MLLSIQGLKITDIEMSLMTTLKKHIEFSKLENKDIERGIGEIGKYDIVLTSRGYNLRGLSQSCMIYPLIAS